MSGEKGVGTGEGERFPKNGKKAIDRLVTLADAVTFYLEDGRPKLRENTGYADAALADALTALAQLREYIRADLSPYLKQLEKQLRERTRRIAELEAELARIRGAPMLVIPPRDQAAGEK
jgi:ABC-type transporter Mla subunit MlaD